MYACMCIYTYKYKNLDLKSRLQPLSIGSTLSGLLFCTLSVPEQPCPCGWSQRHLDLPVVLLTFFRYGCQGREDTSTSCSVLLQVVALRKFPFLL
jgi:hypothetical protein